MFEEIIKIEKIPLEPETAAAIDAVLVKVREEILRALQQHGALHSPQEALGVIFEEFDEYLDEVRAHNSAGQVREAVHLAASAVRSIVEVHRIIARTWAEIRSDDACKPPSCCAPK